MDSIERIQSRLQNADEKTKREALARLKLLQQQKAREKTSRTGGYQVSRFCPQQPFPKQRLFLKLPHLEAFFGGSAGPGKSSALLMGALQHVDIPGYSAVLIRRTYADLSKPGALMDRAHEWLATTGATWNEQKKQWRFPSGAVLSFGYLETERDKYNFQGAEYQFIGVDEVSQIEESSYSYLFSRLRRLKSHPVPVAVRCASNPGGIGADWVKERFIPDQFTPEDAIAVKVWEKTGPDGEVRAFVPARLADNAALDQDEYRRSLQQLDDVTRQQLLLGDWSVKQKGNIFPGWSDGKEGTHVITWPQFKKVFGVDHIPESWSLAIGHDWGSTKGHPAVISCIARASENSPLPGVYFVAWSRTMAEMSADSVAEVLEKTLKEYDMDREQVQLWRMSHEAASERQVYREKYEFPFHAGKHGKTDGIAQITHLLRFKEGKHLFKTYGKGVPNLYFIVDQDQLARPINDRGLKRLREEMVEYTWGETVATMGRGQGVPVPRKWRDDAIDSLRFIFAEWGPGIEPLTAEEKLEKALRPEYRKSHLETLSGPQLDYHRAMREWEEADLEKERLEREATTYERFFKGTV